MDSDAMRSIPYPSSKRLEVRGQCVQIPPVQIHGGHERAWFDGIGIVNPHSKILGVVCRSAGGDGVAAHQMSQIRTEASVRYRSRNGMAIDASRCFKNPATFLRTLTHLCRFRLLLNPLFELIWRVNVNTEEHLGMLGAAILGTLADENACFVWIDPHVVYTVWNQVGLSSQTRDPKTVVRIRGKQGDEGGRGVRRITRRHMELVCRDDAKSGITKLPPELMTDRDNVDGLWGLARLLDGMDYTSGGKEQYQHDERRNHRPGKFYLVATVNWWRFTAVVVSTPTELDNGIREEGKDDYKNHSADGEYEERKIENRVGRG